MKLARLGNLTSVEIGQLKAEIAVDTSETIRYTDGDYHILN